MKRNQSVNIESTPVSRWALRYRRKYGYTFFGLLSLIGIIMILFGNIYGFAPLIPGGYLLWRHYKYHNK